MNLDPDICYAALRSRDPRFDGRFFTAVLTTGIYCRPICPARPPKRGNVRFYPSAAAAEEAGFRACRRCRPESAPGTSGWDPAGHLVMRALRRIDEGVLDEGSVDELAAGLGVGTRHLRRLFDRHLGASPARVAGTRRLHAARMLLDRTDLPVTEVAFASGFSSLRRFNAAFRETFGLPPGRAREHGPPADTFRLHLGYREPFDWDSMAAFLAPRAIPGVETIDRSGYRRAVRYGEAVGVVSLRPDPGRARILLAAPAGLSAAAVDLARRAKRLLDLDADPAPIASHLAPDPMLASSVALRPGLRVPGGWDPFETAVRVVLGQQVSVRGATTLAGRLVEQFGDQAADEWRLFPAPERLAGADLSGIGIPGARADAIRSLARAVHEHRVDLSTPGSLEQAVEQLEALPGIGPWTAHVVAMRALGEPDAFPSGDLGLRQAAGNGRPMPAGELERLAESWRPWRAYAAMHLWMEVLRR